MPKERTPFIGEIQPFVSPTDSEVTFGIQRLGIRAVMQYRNANSAVRYIMEESDGENGRLVTEKDYPVGTMRRDVVVLGLVTWNITDKGSPVAITEETILDYLSHEEFDGIYEEILRVNPILVNDGKPRKNS